MAKLKKDIQYNGQIKKRTYNTMAKLKKDKQYNGQTKKGHTIQWSKEKGHRDKQRSTKLFTEN